MRHAGYARLLHTLYRVALSLVLSMLILLPIEPLGIQLCFWPLLASVLLQAEEKASFSALRLTISKLE